MQDKYLKVERKVYHDSKDVDGFRYALEACLVNMGLP